MALDPSIPILRQDDHLSTIRKRNKILILTFFSLIILLALITGAIIISFVQKINLEAIKSNRALQQFCTPFGSDSCVDLLSSEIKAPSNTNPNHIFMLSLEASIKKLSKISSILADSERNCSNSLSHATGQLTKVLDIIRVDPDVETYHRGNMTAWIDAAGDDLTACVRDLPTAAAAEGFRTMVNEAWEIVMYSGGFLRNCEIVNDNFRYVVYAGRSGWGERSSWDEMVADLMSLSVFFGLQYFVLVLLFCLLLRIYCCKK